jgi:chromate reductase, NAD(P)H dehydrogenase (quinone)
MKLKRIAALCGSTKSTSVNLNLIKAISSLVQDECDVQIFDRISDIPHFNPDLDNENPPEEVTRFRQFLQNSDGILICTPEYAMGVPGTLKNAVDWTVSSCEFSKKPVALITAGSMGEKGHASLLETLRIIEAAVTDETQLVISYAKTKIGDAVITDDITLRQVKSLLNAFLSSINQNKADLTK